MRCVSLVAVLLAACTGAVNEEPVDTDPVEGGETCTELTSGGWIGSGAAFGMAMGVTLTMDVESCTFTLTDWSMDMGPIADSGGVDGDEVTLDSADDDYWASCVGTAEGTDYVSGVCSEDGAAFELELDVDG